MCFNYLNRIFKNDIIKMPREFAFSQLNADPIKFFSGDNGDNVVECLNVVFTMMETYPINWLSKIEKEQP